MNETQTLTRPKGSAEPAAAKPPEKIKYCLYARKSTESEERQILSIDSQIKEMFQLAEREGLNIVEVRRESHSAKETGQREVFNSLVADIRAGKFTGILTWAPDRLSRNAGDLGAIVDLMDQKLLLEIRTHGQAFANSPNEKFLLMILGSTAKLENDHRGENVRRGLRARVDMGLWPNMAPLGYTGQNRMDRKCQLVQDPIRAPIVKQMFEKVAYEKWSGRKIYNWLRFELNFKTRGNKNIALSAIYSLLMNPFYYGMFEYPKKSGNWHEGKHKPLITQELFEQVQAQLKRDQIVRESREFAFTKLFTCGLCGSGVSAGEHYKLLKDGTSAKYIYYGCTRSRDKGCKNQSMREEDLIKELLKLMDTIEINELGIRYRFEEESKRFARFQKVVMGMEPASDAASSEVNIRTYAKYVLKEGGVTEKRDLLGSLKSKIIFRNRSVELLKEPAN